MLPTLAAMIMHLCWAQIPFGEEHKIVGGHPSLGGWNVDAAPAMQWSDGDVWTLDVSLPAGTGLEFKVNVLRLREGQAALAMR